MVDKIRVNGAEIAYRLEGPANAPVVMLSHSLSADMSMWDPQMPALAHYRVLRFDTRGHGRSEATPAPYSLDQLAEDAAALLDALKIPQVHFVGLSMGGMIGQTLTLAHPDKVASLVLAATSSGYPADAAAMWEGRIRTAREKGMAATAQATLERWFSPEFFERGPETIEKVRRMIETTPVEGYCGCCGAISELDLTSEIEAITAPTLIIVGEHDPGTPVSMSEVMYNAIPGSELVILPHVRHFENMEDPEGFNRALTGFLHKHAPIPAH